jgi:DNA-binding response OmpR family regulator
VIRVVICDDSRVVREFLQAALPSLGYDLVGVGESGHDAIRLCAQYKPDLAILDLSMGDLSGNIAARHIVEHGNTKKILMMTSMTQTKDAMESEGFAFIAKPVHRAQLEIKIESLFKE